MSKRGRPSERSKKKSGTALREATLTENVVSERRAKRANVSAADDNDDVVDLTDSNGSAAAKSQNVDRKQPAADGTQNPGTAKKTTTPKGPAPKLANSKAPAKKGPAEKSPPRTKADSRSASKPPVTNPERPASAKRSPSTQESSTDRRPSANSLNGSAEPVKTKAGSPKADTSGSSSEKSSGAAPKALPAVRRQRTDPSPTMSPQARRARLKRDSQTASWADADSVVEEALVSTKPTKRRPIPARLESAVGRTEVDTRTDLEAEETTDTDDLALKARSREDLETLPDDDTQAVEAVQPTTPALLDQKALDSWPYRGVSQTPKPRSMKQVIAAMAFAGLLGIIGGLAGYFYAESQPDMYGAEAEVVLETARSQIDRFLQTQIAVAESRAVAEETSAATGIPIEDLIEEMSVDTIAGSQVMLFRISDVDRTVAIDAVNAWVDAYLSRLTIDNSPVIRRVYDNRISQLREARALIEDDLTVYELANARADVLSQVPPFPSEERRLSLESADLQNQISGLEAQIINLDVATLNEAEAKILSPGYSLPDRVAPAPMPMTALGILAGLAIAALAIFGLGLVRSSREAG